MRVGGSSELAHRQRKIRRQGLQGAALTLERRQGGLHRSELRFETGSPGGQLLVELLDPVVDQLDAVVVALLGQGEGAVHRVSQRVGEITEQVAKAPGKHGLRVFRHRDPGSDFPRRSCRGFEGGEQRLDGVRVLGVRLTELGLVEGELSLGGDRDADLT